MKKYYAIIDKLYVEVLCDTDDEKEFAEVCIKWGQEKGFRAFIGDDEIKVK